MRVVTLMPNSNVHARLVARGMTGEMQIVFPLSTEDFDALCSEQLDTYDVHGLYDKVVPHSTIRVDDATNEFGEDILESVVEDDERHAIATNKYLCNNSKFCISLHNSVKAFVATDPSRTLHGLVTALHKVPFSKCKPVFHG
ncbi:hypothetical protein BDM02DRAFT_3192909 [Thelephora ganbajun]|uniref:Uncharacterized protein n=1 Tax=Thelephora ganbajun TaxID=370292 RepID=A0ACB6YZI0_THEGA|nr:hypothetical protein BDM02DRAFT_3192909 [Thelephora ganbajun]